VPRRGDKAQAEAFEIINPNDRCQGEIGATHGREAAVFCYNVARRRDSQTTRSSGEDGRDSMRPSKLDVFWFGALHALKTNGGRGQRRDIRRGAETTKDNACDAPLDGRKVRRLIQQLRDQGLLKKPSRNCYELTPIGLKWLEFHG
jgi:hypothetical protein